MSSSTNIVSAIAIYAGLPVFICGALGNLLNIRLLWRTRHNPCAFLFITSSFINCIILVYGLFTRILSVGFHLDWSTKNRIWCKTRIALTQTGFLVSLTITCLASIDRFLVSCRQEKYRKLSRLSYAIYAVIITGLFWFAIFVPYLVYAELIRSPTTGLMSCSLIRNDAFSMYQNYFLFPLFFGLLPTIILLTTGILTYNNTKKLQENHQRQLVQKQLTSMMLIQVPTILLSTLPYVIFTEYLIFTASKIKSRDQKFVELLITHIVTIGSYVAFACPFFIFVISSQSFREDVKAYFQCKKLTKLKTNQVVPFSTSRNDLMKITTSDTNQNLKHFTVIQKNISPIIIY